MTLKDTIHRLIKNRQEIKDFSVKRLGIFGSLANGTAKPSSDIDMLVEFNKSTFDNYMGLKLYLESIFRKKVDLVTRKALKPSLKPLILKGIKYVKGI